MIDETTTNENLKSPDYSDYDKGIENQLSTRETVKEYIEHRKKAAEERRKKREELIAKETEYYKKLGLSDEQIKPMLDKLSEADQVYEEAERIGADIVKSALEKRYAEKKTENTPWKSLDALADKVRTEEPTAEPAVDEDATSPVKAIVSAVDQPTSEQPSAATSENPQTPTEEPSKRKNGEVLGINEKKIQAEIDKKTLKLLDLAKSYTADPSTITNNELFPLLSEANFRHPKRAEAVRWMNENLLKLEAQEIKETLILDVKEYRKRVSERTNYYSILDIPFRTQEPKVIKQGYDKTIKKFYPNKFVASRQILKDDPIWDEAEVISKEVIEAYEVLKDDSKRQRYDFQVGTVEEIKRASKDAQESKKQAQEVSPDYDPVVELKVDTINEIIRRVLREGLEISSNDVKNTANELTYYFNSMIVEDLTEFTCDIFYEPYKVTLGEAASKECAELFVNRINSINASVIRAEVVRSYIRSTNPRNGESPYRIKVRYTEPSETPKQSQKANPAQEPRESESGQAGQESANSPEVEQALENLKNADNIQEIKKQLEILSRNSYVFKGNKSGESVIRYPAAILGQIISAEMSLRYHDASKDELYEMLGKITHIFEIDEKVRRELLAVYDLEHDARMSVSRILSNLKMLSDKKHVIETEKGPRYPQEIFENVNMALKAKKNPDEVNQVISQVTSLFDLDVRVYAQIRNKWSAMQRMMKPVPDRLKSRYDSYKNFSFEK